MLCTGCNGCVPWSASPKDPAFYGYLAMCFVECMCCWCFGVLLCLIVLIGFLEVLGFSIHVNFFLEIFGCSIHVVCIDFFHVNCVSGGCDPRHFFS